MQGKKLGQLRMSALRDCQMERLSDLLREGQLSNAQEIANLLKVELVERSLVFSVDARWLAPKRIALAGIAFGPKIDC
jgi:hypothetical protein